jgi:hypothetical protein
MPEPTTSGAAAAATLVGGAVAVPALKIFGVPLGLQPDHLLAGFSGAIAAMALLNSVPGDSDTAMELLKTTAKRIGVAIGSAVTAGYLVPLATLVAAVPSPLLLSLCFLVGAGAQRFLRAAIERGAKRVEGSQ